jgi:hypothetical protein
MSWHAGQPEEADEQAKDGAGVSPPGGVTRPDGRQDDTEVQQQDRKTGHDLEQREVHGGDDNATACKGCGDGPTTAHVGDLQVVAMDARDW